MTFTWPESHRSEFVIDRLLVTRALVGECFDYNGGIWIILFQGCIFLRGCFRFSWSSWLPPGLSFLILKCLSFTPRGVDLTYRTESTKLIRCDRTEVRGIRANHEDDDEDNPGGDPGDLSLTDQLQASTSSVCWPSFGSVWAGRKIHTASHNNRPAQLAAAANVQLWKTWGNI